jgi:hypothetical protein
MNTFLKYTICLCHFLPILFWLALCAENCPAEESYAVLNIESDKVSEKDLSSLTDFLTTEVKNSAPAGVRIYSWNDIQAMLSQAAKKQVLGCDDDRCLASLGGELGVTYLVTGSMGGVGNRYILNLKLIDIDKAQTINRVSKSVSGDMGAFVDEMPTLVRQLLASAVRIQPQSVSNQGETKQFDPDKPSFSKRFHIESGLALSGFGIGFDAGLGYWRSEKVSLGLKFIYTGATTSYTTFTSANIFASVAENYQLLGVGAYWEYSIQGAKYYSFSPQISLGVWEGSIDSYNGHGSNDFFFVAPGLKQYIGSQRMGLSISACALIGQGYYMAYGLGFYLNL